MTGRVKFATAVGSLALCSLLEIATADESAEQDHLVILELGASGEREISEHTSHIGPAVGPKLSRSKIGLTVNEPPQSTYE